MFPLSLVLTVGEESHRGVVSLGLSGEELAGQ